MAQIPDRRQLQSKDGKRLAQYSRIPEGWSGRSTAYRLVRTVRARRGFGTIIHTLTTFTSTKREAQRSAAYWVRLKTRDR